MLVRNLPQEIKIDNGVYAGTYKYSSKFSTQKLWGYYKVDGDSDRDPHFSVVVQKDFTKFHISFDVGGRNIHFYYEFTGSQGLVQSTGNTPWNDGFSSRQEAAAREVLDRDHKLVCHDLAQQFFSAALASELEHQRDANMEEMQSHLKRLRCEALGMSYK